MNCLHYEYRSSSGPVGEPHDTPAEILCHKEHYPSNIDICPECTDKTDLVHQCDETCPDFEPKYE